MELKKGKLYKNFTSMILLPYLLHTNKTIRKHFKVLDVLAVGVGDKLVDDEVENYLTVCVNPEPTFNIAYNKYTSVYIKKKEDYEKGWKENYQIRMNEFKNHPDVVSVYNDDDYFYYKVFFNNYIAISNFRRGHLDAVFREEIVDELFPKYKLSPSLNGEDYINNLIIRDVLLTDRGMGQPHIDLSEEMFHYYNEEK